MKKIVFALFLAVLSCSLIASDREIRVNSEGNYRLLSEDDLKTKWFRPPPFSKKLAGKTNLKSAGPYRLDRGDVLRISLYGADIEETEKSVTVDQLGRINYPFIEPVVAEGKTIDEVKDVLQERISKHYRSVNVSVTAEELLGRQYTILGEINVPGTKVLNGGTTVLSAIADAKGFPIRGFRGHVIDDVNLDHAFLARNGEYIPVNFHRLIKQGDISQDMALEHGDYLYFPARGLDRVYVLGEVGAPSVYSYLYQTTLAEAVAWSGGLNYWASNRAVVIRGSLACPKYYLVDIRKILKGCCCDFPLQSGDIVYVPPQKFFTLKQILYSAIRTFVGTLASELADEAFQSVFPDANVTGDNVIINPGSVPVSIP